MTVVAAGSTLHEALEAWAELNGQGIPIRVIDLYSVKLLDREALLAAARATAGSSRWRITTSRVASAMRCWRPWPSRGSASTSWL